MRQENITLSNITRSKPAGSRVRTLRQQEELPLLRDHLLRLDTESRRDRFHGFMDDGFIEHYAAKCAEDGTVIIAYFEDGVVRGAAELHPPDQSEDSVPEIAFSVEARVRRHGVGSRSTWKKQPPCCSTTRKNWVLTPRPSGRCWKPS